MILTKDGAELARLSDEAYFGERALINAEPRAAAATGALPPLCSAAAGARALQCGTLVQRSRWVAGSRGVCCRCG